MEKIALPDMISHLRKNLQQAQEEGRDKDLRFAVEEVELELQVTMTDETKAGGGVKFWVYNANLEAKAASQAVQRIKLKLAPVKSDGETPVQVAHRRKID
ncbi:MAG: hypothetical protein HQL52_19875 [Magnetococcales bacterium]|nr:hypothetical protein [Magnetococcales bacterium]